MDEMTPEEALAILKTFPAGRKKLRELEIVSGFAIEQFTPRPDDPADFEEQTSFIKADDRLSILLGGTGSGKTLAAAVKTARRVLNEPPPREYCPFWVVGESYQLTCSVCWGEKLRHLIPPHRISFHAWHDRRRNWPAAVGITDCRDPTRTGWVLEFKSYGQGLAQFVSASIGGYWCNEEVTLPILEEIQGRCREYNSPGWADFTPLTVASPEWPRIYDACKSNDTTSEYFRRGWRFYHLNSLRNHYLAEGWAPAYLETVEEEMRLTRQIGVFASFRGKVFKNWRYRLNVIEEAIKAGILKAPLPHPHWRWIRGIDFGYVNPFCCVWVAVDHDGRYYVFDEHYANQMSMKQHSRFINQRDWDVREPRFGYTYCDHEPQEVANLKAEKTKGIWEPQAKVGMAIKDSPGAAARWLNELMRPDGSGKPRFFVAARCINGIKEIEGYKYPEETIAHNPQEDPIDKDNHFIAAVLYACLTDARELGKGPSGGRRDWQPRKGVAFGVPAELYGIHPFAARPRE